MPSARAPPMVAASNASAALSHSRGSGPCTREPNAAMRIASNMLRLSDDRQPSVPIPNVTPRSRILRVAASPEPSLRLLPGLCATEAPASASRPMSSSSSQIACAAVKFGAEQPELVQMADQRRAVALDADHRLHLRFRDVHLHADAVLAWRGRGSR